MRDEPSSPSAIVKVGGSLLDWPELPARLTEFLAGLPCRAGRIVLLTGGGRTVDLIRELDRIHGLGEDTSHVLAIRGLDLTAWLLETLLANSRVVRDDHEIPACWTAGILPILAPSRLLLSPDQAHEPGLPATWDLTSDSIAAWLADRLGADRLILLKSTEIPPGWSRSRAASAGFVDPRFPAIAGRLARVDYRNLRNREGRLLDLPDDE